MSIETRIYQGSHSSGVLCLFWGELQSAKQKGVTVLAQRKPLLFVFVGVLLLRLATRTFCAVLFQEPLRKTREPRLETS